MSSIATKLKIGAGALGAVIASFGAFVLWEQSDQLTHSKAIASTLERAQKFSELALVVEHIAFDVVQVQQFLTDISATRGLDGLDDGRSLAAASAKAFGEDMQKATQLATELEFAEAKAHLAAAANSFPGYYATGQKMAEAYVAGGPASGNAMMGEFDAAAEALGSSMDELASTVDKSSDAATSEILGMATENADATDRARLISALVALSILAFVGGMAFLALRLVRPMFGVTDSMNRLAAGDLDVRAEGGARRDEIGDMVRALEIFRENLREAERMRRQQAEERASAEASRRQSMRDMAQTVESEAGTAVNHVSVQAGTMTRLAGEMASSVANVTEQCQSVAAAAEQAMASATSVTAATQQFSASIQEVSQQLGRARSVTSETVETSERTRAAVSNLAAAVEKIGDVTNIISEIADQTNLLALNATIEAARAGEAGRGFAVVANEVKSLSSQTARSTEEIRKHVTAIQQVTRETTEVVGQIARQISSVDEGSTVIAAAMEEQSATIAEIARHVQETARAAEHVSESVNIVLAEAAKTGVGVKSLSETVGDVDESITRLRTSIIRVVRSASPDVERRTDPRYEVQASGMLVEKNQKVIVEDLSRGGALLSGEANLREGETGKLTVANAQLPYKVLAKDSKGVHVQFAEARSADLDDALARLTRGAAARKTG